METIKDCSFSDMGVILGRSMPHILRSRDTKIIATIIIMPIAFALLLVYALGSVIRTMEDLFLSLIFSEKK